MRQLSSPLNKQSHDNYQAVGCDMPELARPQKNALLTKDVTRRKGVASASRYSEHGRIQP